MDEKIKRVRRTVAIIFALALFLRIYRLDLFPLNHDEVNNTLLSLVNFDKLFGIPVSCFHGFIRPLFICFVFGAKKIFSSPEAILRIPSVIIGVATVFLIYKMASQMYGKKAGIISSLLLCFLPWHVLQSKVGVEPILTPFFGCLISLVLFNSILKKSNFLFLSFCFLLSLGSFYSYETSLLFIPIFLAILLWLRKSLRWLKLKIILLSILVFLVVLFPLLYLCIAGKLSNCLSSFGRVLIYRDIVLKGGWDDLFIGLAVNFKNNIIISFKALFFSSGDYFLFAPALSSPLLIYYLTFFPILFSVFVSFKKREVSDKILLAWLLLGCLGILLSIRTFQARYIIIILPVFIILISRPIAEIFNHADSGSFLKRKLLFLAGILFCTFLVFIESYQLAHYYRIAPTHLEECRLNSYGCKEAAQYLAGISDIENCRIFQSQRMTVLGYFSFFKYGDILHRYENNNKNSPISYYVVWAPESHTEDEWNGLFLDSYNLFKQKFPNEPPIKTIYYPVGLPAIYIFRVEEKI